MLALALLATAGLWIYSTADEQTAHKSPSAIPNAVAVAPDARFDSARTFVRQEMLKQNIPGVSVAAATPTGDLVWAEAFGMAEPHGPTPLTPDTRFHIGTASTMFTAVGLAKLPSLDLDKPIQTDVPQAKGTQTIRQLMKDTVTDDPALAYHRCEKAVDALAHLPNQDGHGWILISAAMEAVSKQPLRTFLKQQIFDPQNMAHTGAESARDENPDHIGEEEEDPPIFTGIRHLFRLHIKPPPGRPASIYEAPSFRQRFRPARNLSCYAGALAYLSTPSDLARFAALQKRPDTQGELHGAKIVALRTIPNKSLTLVVMANATYADPGFIATQIAHQLPQ
ncbi:hypothetical protein F183_A15990 [Bryobacterales bacterium F-183]|nr:hypothetical protein F183_A15990 [Bryobacterales bacterium F-183]